VLKICVASSENSTAIGCSAAGSAPSSPFPGAATKKSSRWSAPSAVWTSMKPPAPGPVSGDSVAHDISTAATAASTALPPARSTSAPACAVSGWPAATTPFMALRLAGDGSARECGRPLVDRGLEAAVQLGHLVLDAAEVARGHHHRRHLRCRHDRRVALRARERAHLAHEVPRAELGELPVAGLHLAAAVFDHEELVRGLAAVDQALARGDVDLVGDTRDLAQLVLRQSGEQRYRPEPCLVHRSPF